MEDEKSLEQKEQEYAAQNPEEFEKFIKKTIALYKNSYAKQGFKLNLNKNCYGVLMGAFFAEKSVEETSRLIHTFYSVNKDDLTDAEKRFIELEFDRCTKIKEFYNEYNHVLDCLKQESGIGHHFQEHGVVYQLAKPKGTFVEYKDICVNRTRYEFEIAEGKTSPSLSMKDAEALGYKVEGKKRK